jgi:hypothetical protein
MVAKLFAMYSSGHSPLNNLKTNALSGDVIKITSFRFGDEFSSKAVHNVSRERLCRWPTGRYDISMNSGTFDARPVFRATRQDGLPYRASLSNALRASAVTADCLILSASALRTRYRDAV